MYKVVTELFKAGDQFPVIPFVEVVGKAVKVAPEQIGSTCVKVGVTIEFTVIVIVTTEAHCPAFGVKVYKVVAVLFKAGDHVPAIPLIEVVGKLAKVPPELIGLTCVKVGVTIGLTVIVIVAFEAHCPDSGVNVYKVVAVLFTSGAQVPEIPFVEVVGRAAKGAPEQIEFTCVKVGVTFALTVIVIVALLASCPSFEVNVYKVVAVLFNAGDQVPVIPFVEVVGKAAKVAPEQIGFTCVNNGIEPELTIIVINPLEAHCPEFGVKVYKVVAVLFNTGDHVPVIPLIEVVGILAKVPPELIGLTCVKVGVTIGLTVIVIVVLEAHCPAAGVKV